MGEKERRDTKMATLYELRLIFAKGEKRTYTAEEIVELLDTIALIEADDIVTPQDLADLAEADEAIARGEFVRHEDIDWDA